MEAARTWRELLGDIIRDPQERHRLAIELGVNQLTLFRWTRGESNPRPQNLNLLLRVISPQQRELLSRLIEKEFPGSIDTSDDPLSSPEEEIPSAFYAKVFSTYRNTTPPLHFWSIVSIVLQQALVHLDPHHLGMEITLVKCMYPSKEGKIRSARASFGEGTPPWRSELEQGAVLLGAESQEGYCVQTCRPNVVQSLDERPTLLPTFRVEYEQSKAVYPILRASRIAGCLAFSSTQVDYFIPSRLAQCEIYTDLVSLAFEDSDFYSLECIDLQTMPSPSAQRPYFANFRKRLSDILIQAYSNQSPLSLVQAEEIVWQQLEEELLMLTSHEKIT